MYLKVRNNFFILVKQFSKLIVKFLVLAVNYLQLLDYDRNVLILAHILTQDE